jgi:hypothetical protein
MKRTLIFAAGAMFIFATADAREVIVNPTSTPHAAIAAGHRVAELDSAVLTRQAPCRRMYVATTRRDGTSYIRESVDCQE